MENQVSAGVKTLEKEVKGLTAVDMMKTFCYIYMEMVWKHFPPLKLHRRSQKTLYLPNK